MSLFCTAMILNLFVLCYIFINYSNRIVHCATREKIVYFASVEFEAGAKQGQQSHK